MMSKKRFKSFFKSLQWNVEKGLVLNPSLCKQCAETKVSKSPLKCKLSVVFKKKGLEERKFKKSPSVYKQTYTPFFDDSAA